MSIVISLALFSAIFMALIFLFDYRLSELATLLLYLLIYAAVSYFRARRASKQEVPVPPVQAEWPISGPIGRSGPTRLFLSFSLSSLLALLNPFQLLQMILQTIGNSYLQFQPARHQNAAYTTKVSYTLPFKGQWLVFNGGATPTTSHSWDVLTQRYAYDFVKADEARKRHHGAGDRLGDYFCYGEEILAAAEGTVVKVLNNIRDAPLVGYGFADFLAWNFIGNHVVIRHADGEYGLYAHLIKGTIPVAVGDEVGRGQLIGRCGHSGHSSEPHLHFHLQDRANFYFAMGLPIRFAQVLRQGEALSDALLTAGDEVQSIVKSE